jgi:thymidylate synthase (FAD)
VTETRQDVQALFEKLGGRFSDKFHYPMIHAAVHRTARRTPYLKDPGVVLLKTPRVDLSGTREFLAGYDQGFENYLDDNTAPITDSEALAKFAGQLCYMSFGENRTKNADAARYFDNIKEQRHGSVVEHVDYSFLIYGLGRDQTHELVRHRVGMGYSQQSQRYVGGPVLRFVERNEYESDPELHARFEDYIDNTAAEYELRTELLVKRQLAGDPSMAANSDSHARTELRKKVRQAARSVLTNEVEAPLIVSMNVRSGRHVIEMRAAAAADTAIRETMFRVYLCLALCEPNLFGDYEIDVLRDLSHGVRTRFSKI